MENTKNPFQYKITKKKFIQRFFERQIIYGTAGKGKVYSEFFVKHNLISLSNEDLKIRLQEIVVNQNFQEEEREQAKRILQNI